jgi:hypothetical protein
MKRWMSLFMLFLLAAPLASAQTKPMAMDENCPMMKKTADMDSKLQALVDDMNKTEGPAKVDKMAAVINELVAQRAMMMKSMDNCPMMKKSTTKKTASAAHEMSCH